MTTFAVVTPTIGTDTLKQCIESVRGQDCRHYIVVDGQQNYAKVNKILMEVGITDQIRTIWLQENIGKGFYGHRVYAAASFLVNEDVLCFLDEDNWVEPNYIEAFKAPLNNQPWAFTLRKIVDVNGNYICDDNCESLGSWPVVGDPNRYHVDTGCFAVPRTLALKVGHAWYGKWGADRQFFAALKSVSPVFSCTNLHTLNYRLGSETSLATKEMFLRGNQFSHALYKGEYPWHQNGKQPTILTYQTSQRPNLLS